MQGGVLTVIKGVQNEKQEIGLKGTGWGPVRFKPGSVPGEVNRVRGVYKGCKTHFAHFVFGFHSSSLPLTRSISLLFFVCLKFLADLKNKPPWFPISGWSFWCGAAVAGQRLRHRRTRLKPFFEFFSFFTTPSLVYMNFNPKFPNKTPPTLDLKINKKKLPFPVYESGLCSGSRFVSWMVMVPGFASDCGYSLVHVLEFVIRF